MKTTSTVGLVLCLTFILSCSKSSNPSDPVTPTEPLGNGVDLADSVLPKLDTLGTFGSMTVLTHEQQEKNNKCKPASHSAIYDSNPLALNFSLNDVPVTRRYVQQVSGDLSGLNFTVSFRDKTESSLKMIMTVKKSPNQQSIGKRITLNMNFNRTSRQFEMSPIDSEEDGSASEVEKGAMIGVHSKCTPENIHYSNFLVKTVESGQYTLISGQVLDVIRVKSEMKVSIACEGQSQAKTGTGVLIQVISRNQVTAGEPYCFGGNEIVRQESHVDDSGVNFLSTKTELLYFSDDSRPM